MTNTLQTALTGAVPKYGAVLATAILVLALAHSVASLAWYLLPADDGGPAPAPEPGQVSRGADTQANAGDAVAQLRLLGRAGPLQGAGQRRIPTDAPDTRLNLTLRGILHDPTDRLARAIIATDGRDEDVYGIGDSVASGTSIDAILADRVILLREGRHESLRLPEDRQGRSGNGASQQSLPTAGPADEAMDDEAMDEAALGGDDGQQDEMRQTLMQNPAEFTRYVQPEPYMDDGEFRGFRLQPGSDPEVMESIGLRPGDVVTEINGQLLDNPQTGISSLRDAASGGRLDLTILRDGATQTVSIDFTN